MSARNAVIVAVLWLCSLAAVAAVAQVPPPRPAPDPNIQVVPMKPNVLSGDDIGFRIDSWQGKTPVGTLVIRVNGQWVEPAGAKKLMPITR